LPTASVMGAGPGSLPSMTLAACSMAHDCARRDRGSGRCAQQLPLPAGSRRGAQAAPTLLLAFWRHDCFALPTAFLTPDHLIGMCARWLIGIMASCRQSYHDRPAASTVRLVRFAAIDGRCHFFALDAGGRCPSLFWPELSGGIVVGLDNGA